MYDLLLLLRYQIMMNCWQSEPETRPSFADLTQQLKRMENQHKVRLQPKNSGTAHFPKFYGYYLKKKRAGSNAIAQVRCT